MYAVKLVLLLLFVGSIRAAYFRDLVTRMKVGTSLNQKWLSNPNIVNMTGAIFNMLSAQDEMKWEVTEPQPGQMNYGPADAVVEYAENHTMILRGHNLVWHKQIPDWLNQLNKTELHAAMVRRIKDIVTRYKGKLYAWDVINEPMVGGALKPTLWFNNFGEQYIVDALTLTREIDPKVKLYINEFGIEKNGSKAVGLFSLVKRLQAKNVPIDGIGFQCHFKTGELPPELGKVMQWFATDLGVEVAVTELDFTLKTGDDAELKQQAENYATVYQTCEDIKECVSTTVWSFTDKYSWRWRQHPCLWDSDFKARPAVAAVEAILK